MNARALPRWTLPALPLLAAPRRRRIAVIAVAALLVAVVAVLLVEWPVIARRAEQHSADAGVAAARAQAVAAARARTAPPKAARHPTDEPAPAAPSRVAKRQWVGDLFAAHSWYVPPPPPPPAAPAPPAAPTAPPFPYAFLGSYMPQGANPVFFLSRDDRVIDVHVGDRLDGVYDFESADGGQLTFNYLPLGIRQSVSGGVSR